MALREGSHFSACQSLGNWLQVLCRFPGPTCLHGFSSLSVLSPPSDSEASHTTKAKAIFRVLFVGGNHQGMQNTENQGKPGSLGVKSDWIQFPVVLLSCAI